VLKYNSKFLSSNNITFSKIWV